MTIKTLVDFNVIAYRKRLIKMKNAANEEYLNHKGTIEGMTYETMRNSFQLVLDVMEEYTSFEKVES